MECVKLNAPVEMQYFNKRVICTPEYQKCKKCSTMSPCMVISNHSLGRINRGFKRTIRRRFRRQHHHHYSDSSSDDNDDDDIFDVITTGVSNVLSLFAD